MPVWKREGNFTNRQPTGSIDPYSVHYNRNIKSANYLNELSFYCSWEGHFVVRMLGPSESIERLRQQAPSENTKGIVSNGFDNDQQFTLTFNSKDTHQNKEVFTTFIYLLANEDSSIRDEMQGAVLNSLDKILTGQTEYLTTRLISPPVLAPKKPATRPIVNSYGTPLNLLSNVPEAAVARPSTEVRGAGVKRGLTAAFEAEALRAERGPHRELEEELTVGSTEPQFHYPLILNNENAIPSAQLPVSAPATRRVVNFTRPPAVERAIAAAAATFNRNTASNNNRNGR